MHRAIFLDRDGVINRKAPEGQYVTRWEDLEILPGVPEAIAALNRAGFRVIVVTNQRCVAKGLIGIRELEELHKKMVVQLASEGAVIDAVYYCPHDSQLSCNCRKPKPGLLLQAAKDHRIDLADSWMIGDSSSDIQAGSAAGCRTLHVCADPNGEFESGVLSASSLLDAVTGSLQVVVRPPQD